MKKKVNETNEDFIKFLKELNGDFFSKNIILFILKKIFMLITLLNTNT